MTDNYRASLANMSGESFAQAVEQLRSAASALPQHHHPRMSSGSNTPAAGQSQSARPIRSSTRKTKSNTPATPSTPVATTAATNASQNGYYPPTSYYGTSGHQRAAAATAPAAPAASPVSLVQTFPQARMTSYSSRMRTGATLLMQPILAPSAGAGGGGGRGGGNDSVRSEAAASSSTLVAAVTASRATGRSRNVVNYAEGASADEFEDDSDDEDFSGSRREAAKKKAAAAAAAALSHQTAQNSVAELDQSYLGKQPPAKFIATRVAAPVKHSYQLRDPIEAAAKKPELLVPIRVEVDTDTHRIRDCFTWNLNEDIVTPTLFAQIFCSDLELPFTHVDNIVNMIRAQLEEHSGVVTMDVGGDENDPTVEDADCRVILRLDVQLDNYHLVDHIEWDLCSTPATPESTPESFAKHLCADLGLRGEAIPIIAHALHEEIIKHKKDAIEWGVLGAGVGAVPEDGGYKRNQRGPKRLRGVWRDWMEFKDYGPRMEILTPEDLEKKEIERERASRRMRRETSKFQRNAGTYYRDSRPARPSRLR